MNRASIFRACRCAPLLLLATCVLLFAVYRDLLWSNSFELVRHYGLVTHAAEFWLPSSAATTYGAPNWSHAAAATLGGLLGSHFLGMHSLALLAVLVLWGALAMLMAALPRALAITSGVGLVILLSLARLSANVPLLGQEIVHHYLFSQLLAQALAIGLVAFCLSRELRKTATTGNYLLLLAGALVCAQASLLPALQLLVLLLVLLVLDALTPLPARAPRFGLLLVLPALAGLAWLAVWRAAPLADAIDAVTQPYAGRTEALLCLFVALASTAMLRFWRRLPEPQLRRACLGIKYIGAFGLAVAAGGIAHLLALKFGRGSQWSALQPAFALDVMALLDLASLAALLFFHKSATSSRSGDRPWIWFAPLLLAASVVCVLPHTGVVSARAVVALEQQVQFLRLAALPDIAHTADYAVDLAQMPPAVDAMLSLGALKAPYREAAQQMSGGHAPADLCSAGTLITSRGGPLQNSTCARAHPATALVMLDAACVRSLGAPSVPCGGKFDFRPNGNIKDQQIGGFGQAEPQGRWTIASQASFTTDAAAALQAHFVVIDAFAFVPANHRQHLRVRINDVEAGQFVFEPAQPQRTLRLALPEHAGASVRIDFMVPDAVSPASLGLSADARKLAISVRSLQFE